MTVVLAVIGSVQNARAQTTTYHLHKEASVINSAKQLKTAGPDVTGAALQSGNLKGSTSNFEVILGQFETQTAVPAAGGFIPAGSVVTYNVWMKKSSADGVYHPTATLFLNFYTGSNPALCSAGQGPGGTLPKLTTTLVKYTFSCSMTQTLAMTTSDRFFLDVGAWVDTSPGSHNSVVELDVEGVLGGNFDSTVVAPLPQPPTITSLTPTLGIVGQAVTIAGTNFGTTQGNSGVTFNGATATPTAWSSTSITAPVPTGATTGPTIVTVNGQPSGGVTFTVVPPPTITSLTPSSGVVGQTVTVTGTNFGVTQGSSSVAFNGVTATPTAWSQTSVTAPVPAGATTGPVVITVNAQPSAGATFTVTAVPTINSLTPSSGSVGQTVTIAGSNFGASQNNSTVAFNGTSATPASWTATSITVAVPAGSTTGSVVVTVNGQASVGVGFTVISPPSITSLTPSSGHVGQAVTIAGANFGSTQGTSIVQFGGTTASVTGWSGGTITAVVPTTATTGPVTVTVNGATSNGATFTVVPAPTIGALTPALGAIGQTVAVSGANFGGTQGTSTVRFNGTVAAVSNWSDSAINVTLPAGATTGAVTVTVAGMVSNGVTFTVVPPPTVTSVQPSSGYPGDTVTIAGSDFGPGTPTVTLNGSSAMVLDATSSTITLNVPTAATSGQIVVTVNGASSDGGPQFTVLRSAVVVATSPNPATVGQTVTIDGSDFGVTQQASTVTFNGAPSTVVAWTDTNIQVVVPPVAGSTATMFVTVDGHDSNHVTFPVLPDPTVPHTDADITDVSAGGVGTVSIWPTDDGDGYNADIGVWSGYTPSFPNEPQACTFLYVDIDVHDGGALAFTYGQRSWGRGNDFLDVYVLTPGTTWDPGTIWTEDNSERCFRQDWPAGVVPLIETYDEAVWHFDNTLVTSPDHGFVLPLTDWANQHVRVVFRQWNDGYGDETQSRVRNLSVRPHLSMHLTLNAFLPFDNIPDPNLLLGAGMVFEGDGDSRTWNENGSSRTSQIMDVWNQHLHPDDIFLGTPADWAGLTQQYEQQTSLDGNLKLTTAAHNDWVSGIPLKVAWGVGKNVADGCSGLHINADTVTVNCSLSTPNGIRWFDPSIAYSFSMTFGFTSSNLVNYSISGCRKFFPAYEVWAGAQLIYAGPNSSNPYDILVGCSLAVAVEQTGVITLP